jgi:hypothetical protein
MFDLMGKINPDFNLKSEFVFINEATLNNVLNKHYENGFVILTSDSYYYA